VNAFRLLVFLSGFAGLVYEVVWAEELALLFGNTAAAHAAILSIFLGGMAAGYAAIGPLSDRVDDPLDLYGRLEIGIGLCGIIAPRVFASAPVPLAAAFLLLPTALMGGTLPPLVRAAAARGTKPAEGIAGLYGLNSAGAALGVVFAGFWAIPNLGLALSGSTAAVINVGVGVAALWISQRAAKGRVPPVESVPDERRRVQGPVRAALLGAAFLSGFAALAYEIGWIRLLALVLGSSTYSFTVMLASFVAGIALGGGFMRRWISRIENPAEVFAWIQLALGAFVLVCSPFYGKMPYLFHLWAAKVPRVPEAFWTYETGKFLFCFAVMLVPAALLGAGLPLAAAADSTRSRLGAGVGRVFGLNTAGNVLAALTAGLFLMPALGLRGLICGAAALNLAAGFLLIAVSRRDASAGPVRVAGSLFLAGVLFVFLGGGWDREALIAGTYLHRLDAPAFSRKEFAKQIGEPKILYYKDGANATVAVTKGWGIIQLRVNGKVDATDGIDMTTQMMLAQAPLLLRPEAKDVMIVGLGSGVTAAAALTHPVESVIVAEISPEVVEASAFFAKVNAGALEDPRLGLRVSDARRVLSDESTLYDVVISEPSNPWMAGISDLYTREFFELVKSRLKENGLFVQWLHTYLMTDDSLRLVLRTLAVVFPDVHIWTLGRDILIIAGEKEVEVDLDATAARMKMPRVEKALASALISTPASFFALHAFDDAAVRRIAGWPGPVNEDAFPLLEYAAPKGVFLARRSELLDQNDGRLAPDPEKRLLLTRWFAHSGELTVEDYEAIFHYHWIFKSPFAGTVLLDWARRYPEDPAVRELLATFADVASHQGLERKADEIRGILPPAAD
jgi:spermidine synthase